MYRILSGDLGSKVSEESYLEPTPMIEIDAKPIIWDMMKLYATHPWRSARQRDC